MPSERPTRSRAGEFPYAEFESRWPWLRSTQPWVNRYVQDWYVIQDEKLGRRKGGTINFLWAHPNPVGGAWKMSFTKGRVPLWGWPLKQRLETMVRDTRHLTFELFTEFLPIPGCRVELDPQVKDAWGLPSAHVRWEFHPRNIETAGFLIAQGKEILRRMGARNVTSPTTFGGESKNLLAGTCRFGTDPSRSVLDKDCRAHEVDNLYVTDGSFLPSSGGVPLTFEEHFGKISAGEEDEGFVVSAIEAGDRCRDKSAEARPLK